jgi:hypothetical protein
MNCLLLKKSKVWYTFLPDTGKLKVKGRTQETLVVLQKHAK